MRESLEKSFFHSGNKLGKPSVYGRACLLCIRREVRGHVFPKPAPLIKASLGGHLDS